MPVALFIDCTIPLQHALATGVGKSRDGSRQLTTMMTEQETIKRLSIDRAFGILTRNALELEIENRYIKSFDIIFVDFTNVHTMNEILGYEHVNDLFKRFFNELQLAFPAAVIGRWFSGDEIAVVVGRDPEQVLDVMRQIAPKFGLAFWSTIVRDQQVLEDARFTVSKRSVK